MTTPGVDMTSQPRIAALSSTFFRLIATPRACATYSISFNVVLQLAQPVPNTLMSFILSSFSRPA